MYDKETYPNFYCCVLKFVDKPGLGIYEISERRNTAEALVALVLRLTRMVGYNNLHFDWPLMNYIIQAVRSGEAQRVGGLELARRIYALAMDIIESGKGAGTDRYRHRIWDRDILVPQLDLMLVHNMDNKSRMTGLKALQFAMRSPKIQELPFPVGTWLTYEQMDTVADYGAHDVWETERFYHESRREIEFREALGPDFLNLGETKIGKKILRDALERASPGCTKRSTEYSQLTMGQVMFPYIRFQTEPFQKVQREMRETSIDVRLPLKKSFPKLTAHNNGLRFDFGSGGLHGSIPKQSVLEDEEHEILDVDVESFYPRMAIVNGMRPDHLGDSFCAEYNGVFNQRQTHPKGTPENTSLKFALNAVFGDSGADYGPFRDLAFMLGITVNGQMLLCMLAEPLFRVPGLRMIQANTDGLTFRYPRRHREQVADAIAWWQAGTGLKLELKNYRLMHIRDVNNYVAQEVTGKLKHKGAYNYTPDWWKDHSMLAVAKAAEAAIIRGEDPAVFLRRQLHEDPWDFLIRIRATGQSRLTWSGLPIQQTARLYVSRDGAQLVKHMPKAEKAESLEDKLVGALRNDPAPPAQGEREWKSSVMLDGRRVRVCNEFDGRPPADIDLDYYETEVRKLVKFRKK